jgi:polar amino acid transport system ATP-binding protein
MLSVEEVHKDFNGNAILNGVSMELSAGEIVGLVGPSGCGKSTLLRCIGGLERISSGKITVRGRAGFMFQDFQLFPHMTVVENVSYATRLKVNREFGAAKNVVREILERLGLWPLRDRYPGSLSGGQKQRVAMARALALSPNLLLCDEPTSGLDADSTDDVAKLLRSAVSNDRAVLIASHDLEFLGGITNRILRLRNGKIVKSQSAKEKDNEKEGETGGECDARDDGEGAPCRVEFCDGDL